MGSDPTGAFGAVRRRPWVSLLTLLTALSGGLLLTLRAEIGFFLDDWALVIYREGGPSDWLLPHNEHIIVLPSAIYKLSLSLFGMTAIPLHIFALALFLGSVWLLFFWLRPLVGEAASVPGCAVLLFLGAAADDLIWAFQMGFFAAACAGLGALLLLRRNSLRSDLLACLLLVVAVLFSSLAIPLAVGAAVQILLRQDPTTAGRGIQPDWHGLLRRSWVFLAPAAVYIAWWAGWGHLAENSVSLHNAVRAPLYVLSALGYAGAALTGPFPIRQLFLNYLWAIPGLILAGGLGYALHRRKQVPPAFLVAAAIALTFWILSSLNYMPGREFAVSRYQYPGVIFLLMLLGGTFSGLRPGPRAIRWIGAVAVFAVAVNLAGLVYVFNNRYMDYQERNLAGLTAIDLARDTVKPRFSVGISTDDGARVFADDYLAVVDRYGSPAWSDSDADGASAKNRKRLDEQLVLALPVQVLPVAEARPVRRQCSVLTASEGSPQTIPVTSELLYLRSEEMVVILLGRFGSGAEAVAWALAPGEPVGYMIPPDRSTRPWQIGFRGSGEVTVCPARPF